MAVDLHDDYIRTTIEKYDGYELKEEGDRFVISFPDVNRAVDWCCSVQIGLLDLPWPHELLENMESRVVNNTLGRILFRGLRVKMSIHCGEVFVQENLTDQRMDYFGPVMNQASKMCCFMASGGQILLSSSVVDHLLFLDDERISKDDGHHHQKWIFGDLGYHFLDDMDSSVRLYQIIPSSLRGRRFPTVRSLREKSGQCQKRIEGGLEDRLSEMEEKYYRALMLAEQEQKRG